MTDKPYKRTIIAREGRRVPPALMKDADLCIIGDEVVKDKYDLRRTITERQILQLVAESEHVTRL